MATDSATVMAIGDVHLGTRPASVPSDLGVEVANLTPRAGLEIAIERAVAERVDAVVFAGDVVESTSARFEAMPPLERAVQRLLEAGIAVFAVAGNHDVEALPRLARMIDGFTLLGAGGRWSSALIERAGRPLAELVGWSFPEPRVRTSPLAALLRDPLPPAAPGVPRLGVLHGDLDASGGHYAPFAGREIDAAGLDGWVFGHLHRPSLSCAGGRLRGYLGSLVGLDPSETGAHGPWLIRLPVGRPIEARQLALAPLRWEALEVALGADHDAEDAADRVAGEVERFARGLAEQGAVPLALGVRVRLTGAPREHEKVRGWVAERRWSDIRRQAGDTVVFVDRVDDDLDLAVDLEALARGDDPPALVARRILELRRGGEAARALLEEARSALREVATDPRWLPLGEGRDRRDPLDDEPLREVLLRAATAFLHALLAQRTESPEGRR